MIPLMLCWGRVQYAILARMNSMNIEYLNLMMEGFSVRSTIAICI